MPGHTTGHRVNTKHHVDALVLQSLCQFIHGVLGLSNGEAVTRNNDHTLCVAEENRNVFRRTGLHRAIRNLGRAGSGTTLEGAEDRVADASAHGAGHRPGQQCSRSTHQRSRHQQQGVAKDQTGGRHGETGHSVQQRNDDGNIGSTHGENNQNTHDQTDGHEGRAQEEAAIQHQPHGTHQGHQGQDHHYRGLALEHHGASGHQLLQLGEGDHRTRERDASHENGEGHSDEEAQCVSRTQLEEGHNRRCSTTHTVEQCYKLGHLSHLDHARSRNRND